MGASTGSVFGFSTISVGFTSSTGFSGLTSTGLGSTGFSTFTFGSVGLIDVTLKRRGRPDYNKSYESIEWDVYSANASTIVTDYVHTIPVYDKNINLSLHLNSTHPAPATLHSMTWEGDYNPKFYQRV